MNIWRKLALLTIATVVWYVSVVFGFPVYATWLYSVYPQKHVWEITTHDN